MRATRLRRRPPSPPGRRASRHLNAADRRDVRLGDPVHHARKRLGCGRSEPTPRTPPNSVSLSRPRSDPTARPTALPRELRRRRGTGRRAGGAAGLSHRAARAASTAGHACAAGTRQGLRAHRAVIAPPEIKVRWSDRAFVGASTGFRHRPSVPTRTPAGGTTLDAGKRERGAGGPSRIRDVGLLSPVGETFRPSGGPYGRPHGRGCERPIQEDDGGGPSHCPLRGGRDRPRSAPSGRPAIGRRTPSALQGHDRSLAPTGVRARPDRGARLGGSDSPWPGTSEPPRIPAGRPPLPARSSRPGPRPRSPRARGRGRSASPRPRAGGHPFAPALPRSGVCSTAATPNRFERTPSARRLEPPGRRRRDDR